MNLSIRSNVTRRAALGALAAAALVAGGLGPVAALADGPSGMPSLVASGQTAIATDKPAYAIGDPITVSYTLPGPGNIVITDHQGTSVSTLRAGFSHQNSGTITGTVTPPTGNECLRLEHKDAKGVRTTAETCFMVTEKAPEKAPEQTPEKKAESQTPAAGLYTLRNKATDQMLDSNTEKKVYPHNPNGGAFQKWMLETAPDGHFFLRDLATGFYLDSNANGDVYTHVKNGGGFQQWKLEPGTDAGYFVLRNRETTMVLIDSSGLIHTGALAAGAEPSARAQWKLQVTQP